MRRAILLVSLFVGCSGPAARPVAPIEASPIEPAPAEEPEPTPIPLEEDPAPDGAACFATDECAEGEHCRGPAGCEAAWACGAPRECGEATVAYCGCDGMTFYALANCPGRPFASGGPCEALGEAVDDSAAGEAVEGNTLCQSNDDCRRGYVCAGLEGCGTFWTCVRRARMRPRCSRSSARFCSCDGETFEASSTCPGRPFAHRDYCPGDEPAPAPEREPPAVAARPPQPERPAARRPRPPPPARPAPPAAPEPVTCTSNRDCSRGEICQGAEGCDAPWQCARPTERCVSDTQYFCGCDGRSFTASMTCPGRPHRHRGSCAPD